MRCPQDKFEFRGPAVGRRFSMHFKGSAPLASANAQNAKNALYNKVKKEWTRIKLKNVDGEEMCPMVFEDKGGKQESMEACLRRMSRAFKELAVGDKIETHIDKRGLVLSANLVELCRAYSEVDGEVLFKWKSYNLTRFKVTRGAIESKYAELAGFHGGDDDWEL